MKIVDLVLIVVMTAYGAHSLPRRRWFDVAAALLCIVAFALDLAGIGGPRL